MPTSRRRRGPSKKDRARAEDAPYTKLARGVIADEEFGRVYRRAMWSFHRAPLSQLDVEGEPAADAAAARGLEWFLFGLQVPPRHLTPAEIWIERESEARGWSEATRREYLTLTTSRYGLFGIKEALGDQYFAMEDLAQGGRLIGWNVAAVPDVEPNGVLAGWVFPATEAPESTNRHSVVISPGSFVLPDDAATALTSSGGLSELSPLEVEEALGASLDWLAETASAVRARLILEDFLIDAADGGIPASHLATELAQAVSPATVVMRLIDELDPMTSVEPLVVMALCSMVWLTAHARAGVPVRTLQRRGERWMKDLQRLLKGSTESTAEDQEPANRLSPGSSSRLTEHEVARLRALAQNAAVWIAEQRVLEVPAQASAGYAYFPECVAVIEEKDYQILGLEAVTQKEPDLSLLRVVVAAMTSPRNGTARRPALVKVRSERAAAQLASLHQIGIKLRVQYIDPVLEQMWDAVTHRGLTNGIASLLPLDSIAPSGYLGIAGSNVSQLQEFFEAAAEFHGVSPWKFGDELRPFAVQPKGQSWPPVPSLGALDEGLIVVVSGAKARDFHLRVCLDDDAFEEMLSGEAMRASERASTLTLEYRDQDEVTPHVLADTREHRLALHSREAIPVARRTQPATPTRLAAGDELTLLAAVLRALTVFTRLHRREVAATSDEIVRTVDVPAYGRFEVRIAPGE